MVEEESHANRLLKKTDRLFPHRSALNRSRSRGDRGRKRKVAQQWTHILLFLCPVWRQNRGVLTPLLSTALSALFRLSFGFPISFCSSSVRLLPRFLPLLISNCDSRVLSWAEECHGEPSNAVLRAFSSTPHAEVLMSANVSQGGASQRVSKAERWNNVISACRYCLGDCCQSLLASEMYWPARRSLMS